MSRSTLRFFGLVVVSAIGVGIVCSVNGQPPFGFGGGTGGGPGGGPNAPDQKMVEDFDQDGDGRLNAEERKSARASLKKAGNQRGPRRGPHGGGRDGNRPTGKPGPRVNPEDVDHFPDAEMYDANVLRTLFLEFSNDDWEQELADFKPTDVEVPATLTVDGKAYPNVGVGFRGASSFFMIPEGSKRSLNISMDYADDKQRLYGQKTLNLLNCNGDASMMSSFLYSNLARQRIAAPLVNFVNVVINGRSWGVYANVQQFNKDFVKENFDTKKGARWKVSGNPRGDAGLRYLGEEVQPYRQRFDIKSKDKDKSWQDLIHLCKVLNETPADQLEMALRPILDIDGVLWFLAVDVATINSDGYWTRASDYSIYQSPDGIFHILPHDMNEAFQEQHGSGGPGGRGGPGGPAGDRRGGPPGGFFGMFGGPPPQGPRGGRQGGPSEGRRPAARQRPPGMEDGRRNGQQNRGRRERGGAGGGYELDPLVGMTEDRFPLRSKLLAVPKFRELYLKNLHDIAAELLSWDYLGPQVESARDLIKSSVKADTRKLATYTQFINATSTRTTKPGSLREFAQKRSKYLLKHPEIKALGN
jgi:spore coat protein CotH